MSTHAPELPIAVDDDTGVWTTNNLPMLYVPRHFFLNNHMMVEGAIGRETYARALYDAGYKSAWFWCEAEAKEHGLQGFDVFHHYMNRLSQRGWGQFDVVGLDEQTGTGRVVVRNSAFVLGADAVTGRACYMFAGWFPGSLEWVGENLGTPFSLKAEEVQCAAHDGSPHCTFEITLR